MNNEIVFMPLGGGQRVGASCYFLKLGDNNIILDAGIGIENGVEFEPDFHSLLTSPYIQSLSQISHIFISHAHSDHVGYLTKLMGQAPHATVYMTEATKVLTEFQLYDRLILENRVKCEETRLAIQSLLDRIAIVGYMQEIKLGNCKVAFYPAGHIPGAMMVMIEFQKRKLLYTGDYSLTHTMLTQGCFLPRENVIDTVIMCGLHAKHPDYAKKGDDIFKCARYVLDLARNKKKMVWCVVPQLSKSIEFLSVLNSWNVSNIPIYLDPTVMNVIYKMERLSVPILDENNKTTNGNISLEPHVYLTASRKTRRHSNYKVLTVDFVLHEDFDEMKQFLKVINPKQAILVHCGKSYGDLNFTIEQEMMKDCESRTQFVFAEEKEVYML